ncbi:patatin family protein [Flammeovirga sp. EKP202]|uniref:patatin-like phospholipase family protein n=1 Tax=Flammeovirga sp. EKP202 TaxID=2770592 RepID=UPI00165F7D79|nr:patatin family protein [Flammeovirga sp. EKP202]MBD0404245.1 patatin family protein [Flammeovirga sp. EKP202]
MKNKVALVLEGGGSRGMFTAGILESFLINNINFDSIFGISAGALYGASFASKQFERNKNLNTYIEDKRYGGFKHLLLNGSYFSWDFIMGDIAHRLLPYDYDTLRCSPDFYVGVSNCNTGKSEFFVINKLDKPDIVSILTASGSLPFVSPIVKYKGEEYLDGGLTNSIPYDVAFENGADKIVVVLTRPEGYVKPEMKFTSFSKWYYRKHPKVHTNLINRAHQYNESIKKLKELEQQGKAYLIYPQNELNVGRIERKVHKTQAIYHEAIEFSKRFIPEMVQWMKE